MKTTKQNIAIVCLHGLGKHLRRTDRSVPAVYSHDDSSDYNRLNKLNNRIKHFDEDIVEAAAKQSPTIMPVAPVWVTNDGL